MVKRVINFGVTMFLVLAAVIAVSPVIAVTILSLSEGAYSYVDFWIWEPTYLGALSNSIIISLASSAGAVIVSTLAAYVFAKVKFRGRDILFYLYIIVMMMPFQVTLLPQYIVSRNFGLYDTPLAMILPGVFSPFAAFLLTQVMKTVPDEIIEAARMDTSSTWRILGHIIIPAVRPGIVCAWVLCFTEQWNAVAEPLVLMETREKYPLAVMLDEIGAGDATGFAAVAIFLLLPLLLYLFFEEEIMEGLEAYRMK